MGTKPSRDWRVRHLTIGVAALWAMCQSPRVLAAGRDPAAALGNPAVALINLAVSLLIIVLLILGLARFAARRGSVQNQGGLRVIAARQVAPNRWVQVVDWAGKRYLIGVGEQVTLLAADVSDPGETAEAAGEDEKRPDARFAVVLGQALATARQRHGRGKENAT